MRFAHFGDIHIRPFSRHSEYREAFQKFFDNHEQYNLDHIIITGDIVHEKTQRITPEIIDMLVWLFTNLSKIAPVHIILGNHDGNLANETRQDAISPIVSALDNPNIRLYKKSGNYLLDKDFGLGVFSCFDEDNWSIVKKAPEKISIALFHGPIMGATTDIGYEIESSVGIDFFKDFDFVFLGDIHRHQFLDKEKRIAYPGSTIQQDFGESIDNHGFLLWNIYTSESWTVEHIEFENKKPFVTIPWNGLQETIKEAERYPEGSRFRIQNEVALSQNDIGQINNELKKRKKSNHIVYKFDKKSAGIIDIESAKELRRNLRDAPTIMKLLREFLGKEVFDEDGWEEVKDVVEGYVGRLEEDGVVRGTTWIPRRIEFSNIMQYGEHNIVDFDKLDKVVGIFGPNTLGKSTIIAAITYALFGKIDRDINQNQNYGIINLRKTECECKFFFTVSGTNYMVHRITKRVEKKDGRLGVQNSVWFKSMDSDWNVVEELRGEKGSDTDKEIRKIVGVLEDFKLTALTTQRKMEAFIEEKSTDRKQIVSKFRDLQPLNDLHDHASSDFKEMKTIIKSLTLIDWVREIENLENEKIELTKSIEKSENMLDILRNGVTTLQNDLSHSLDTITKKDVLLQQNHVEKLKEQITLLEERILLLEKSKNDSEKNLVLISREKDGIPIESIKDKLNKQNDLEKKISGLQHKLQGAIDTLSAKEKTIGKLKVVPCGDSFPTCKYIRDAHEEKENIEPQKEYIQSITDEIQRHELSIVDENYKLKIDEYNNLEKKQASLENEIYKTNLDLESAKKQLEDSKFIFHSEEEKLKEYEISAIEESDGDKEIKEKISKMKEEIVDYDSKRIFGATRLGKIESEIEKLISEKEKFDQINEKYKIYENLTYAFGKKGIANQILRMDLPSVNSEIKEVLRGVVGFDIELELEEESDKLEIYLDYGDSRRPIELGSGMEQVVASLAIRVGLLNASNLPKPNMLILDEPFANLDSNHVDDVVRMVISLKKWFRMILLISHNESVKDIAAHLLEITKEGQDSYISHE